MNNRPRLRALLLVTMLLSSAARSAASPEASPGAPADAPLDIAAADNTFGFRLLNAVQKKSPNANVVLSPVSAALNLSMVMAGAEGETRREVLSVLSVGAYTPATVNAANAVLIKAIRRPAQSVTLSLANSLWADSRHGQLRADYLEQTRTSYDAEIVDLDFSSPNSAARINGWAAKETQGRIPKIIDKIGVHERLLLLDAVYFKGQWMHRFDKAKTQQKDFTLAGGSVKQVARMAQSERFDYFETPQLQAIRLAFGDGDLVMDVFLPEKSSSLEALEGNLTAERWKSWQAQFRARPGTIELPRFELKADYPLNAPLQALGMRRAFQEDAQLTDMFSPNSAQGGGDRFFISFVGQSTFWKVDEEGSEAAAVTISRVLTTAVSRPLEPFRMIVDRPFFCAIEDLRNGALLFIGAIQDPTR